MEKTGIYLLLNLITGGEKQVVTKDLKEGLKDSENIIAVAESGKGKMVCKRSQ